MSYLWKIAGEAGHGIMTIGYSLAKLAHASGYYAFGYAEYPSLIRGGHNTYELHLSTQPISATKDQVDCLICLNAQSYQLHKHRLHQNSLVLADVETLGLTDNGIVAVPYHKMLKDNEGNQIMTNTILLSVTAALLALDLQLLQNLIKQHFNNKSSKIQQDNLKFAKLGYHWATEHLTQFINPILSKRPGPTRLTLTGNDAFALGACRAECKFFASYPMTPASSILTSLATWQTKTGMIVRHSEDEIAAISNAIGAATVGARAATATSGGGFALMTESISLSGMAEIPLVILLSQRPGPATGMPTWTEDGDLLFACYAGHGEFPKIVLAAGDAQEMFTLTLKAFDLADIYQLPVIILSDKLLSEAHYGLDQDWLNKTAQNYKINRGKIITQAPANYKRYQITADGISPLLIPQAGQPVYQANSYEHQEDGRTSEQSDDRKTQSDKRARKLATYLCVDYQGPTYFGNEQAQIVFVSWGATKGAILSAQQQLKTQGVETGYYHFTHLYPLDQKPLQRLFTSNRRYILVENNSQGQFGKLLRQQGIDLTEQILRYDGRPISAQMLIDQL